jgi:EPS-associated MarR family transcriptional regulator
MRGACFWDQILLKVDRRRFLASIQAEARVGRITVLTDEVGYQLLRLLSADPTMSQRNVASALGISLGKTNYCLKSLVRKGWIKATNFKNSRNKAAYMYLLTPRGVEAKANVTMRFLQQKMREYEALRTEIEHIREEARRYSG